MPLKKLPKLLFDVLTCPKCKGGLRYPEAGGMLVCDKCELAYRIEKGMPIMLAGKTENVE